MSVPIKVIVPGDRKTKWAKRVLSVVEPEDDNEDTAYGIEGVFLKPGYVTKLTVGTLVIELRYKGNTGGGKLNPFDTQAIVHELKDGGAWVKRTSFEGPAWAFEAIKWMRTELGNEGE